MNAIYSDKAKAKKYAEERNKCKHNWDEFRVEDWVIDEDPVPTASDTWICKLDFITGEISEYEHIGLTERYDNEKSKSLSMWCKKNKDRLETHSEVTITSFVSGDHAVKLAAELYQKFLRVTSQYQMSVLDGGSGFSYFLLLSNPLEITTKDFLAMFNGSLENNS